MRFRVYVKTQRVYAVNLDADDPTDALAVANLVPLAAMELTTDDEENRDEADTRDSIETAARLDAGEVCCPECFEAATMDKPACADCETNWCDDDIATGGVL